jgi:MFS family permease
VQKNEPLVLHDHSCESDWPSRSAAVATLVILTAAYSMSFASRAVLNLLVEDVKSDLGVSDIQISLLTGLSFSAFYVIVGLPLARLMDSRNRRNILAATVPIWSLATIVSGLARTFSTLFVARVGLGCGEAGLVPGASSLLADCFPKKRLAIAMGVFSMGIYIGSGLALIIGGHLLVYLKGIGAVELPWLGALKPWQMVFFTVGAACFVLFPLMLMLREPLRRKSSADKDTRRSIPVAEVVKYVAAHWQVYIGVLLGFALMVLVGAGISAWIPAFFMRKFGWSAVQVGNLYGLSYLICGALGAVCGGLCAAYLRGRGVLTGNLVASLGAFAILVPLTIAFPLVPNASLALALTAGMNFCAGFPFGGGLATLQEVTPNAMRAQVAAVYGLCVSLIGGGLGPTVVGLFTDRLFHDPAGLPYSIAITAAIFSTLAAVLLWVGYRGYVKFLRQTAEGDKPISVS